MTRDDLAAMYGVHSTCGATPGHLTAAGGAKSKHAHVGEYCLMARSKHGKFIAGSPRGVRTAHLHVQNVVGNVHSPAPGRSARTIRAARSHRRYQCSRPAHCFRYVGGRQSPSSADLTRTSRGSEAMPFATTSSLLSPDSCLVGTSKCVDTTSSEATAMLLWSCVRL